MSAVSKGVGCGVELHDVTVTYGAVRALDGITCRAQPGRFTALLGANGAGKTTLLSVLTGLAPADGGRAVVAGHDVARERIAALSGLGVVFQATTLDLDLTVAQNLAYFAGLQDMDRAAGRERAATCLERLGMAERANEKVRALNGGHRRRVEIARALMHRPRVLLLDEPSVGLDAVARAKLVADVHALAHDGVCVVWATHLVDEIDGDDDVILLERGRVSREGRAASFGDLAAVFTDGS